jgi:hypothetical protein
VGTSQVRAFEIRQIKDGPAPFAARDEGGGHFSRECKLAFNNALEFFLLRQDTVCEFRSDLRGLRDADAGSGGFLLEYVESLALHRCLTAVRTAPVSKTLLPPEAAAPRAAGSCVMPRV